MSEELLAANILTYRLGPTHPKWGALLAIAPVAAQDAKLLITNPLAGGAQTINGGLSLLGGPLTTAASTSGAAGFVLSPGVAPTTPLDGAFWSNDEGVFVRVGFSTLRLLGVATDVDLPTLTPGSGNAYVWDDFTRPDAASLGTATSGGTWTDSTGGAMKIVSNAGVRNVSSSDVSASLNVGANDYRVSANVSIEATGSSNQYAGLSARMPSAGANDAAGGYTFQLTWVAGAPAWTLEKRNNPSWTMLASGSGTFTRGQSVKLELEVNGSTIKCFLDDVLVATVTDSSYLTGAHAGLKVGATTHTIVDNFRAWKLPYAITVPGLTAEPATLGANIFTGRQVTAASTGAAAGFNLGHGTAPVAPVNGDVWTTTSGLYVRVNGATIGPLGPSGATLGANNYNGVQTSTVANNPAFAMRSGGSGNYVSLDMGRTSTEGYLAVAGTSGNWFTGSVAGDIALRATNTLHLGTGNGSTAAQLKLTSTAATFAVKAIALASAAGGAGFNLPHGAAPSAPVNGDLWTTTTGLSAYINGVTQTFLTSTSALDATKLSGALPAISGASLTGITAAQVGALAAGTLTTSVGEGTNLYWTQGRFDTAFAARLGAASGAASLDAGGKIPTSQLPALAITDTFVVASQAAMLALSTAEVGDIAVRSDLNKTFILKTTGYATLANWQELLTPTDSVLSVNGQTGAVTLTTAHVTEGANQYWTEARFDTAFGLKTTANLTENTNLYFTNARADARITAALASTAPEPLGVAGAGNGTTLARANHVHAMPSAADVGAAPAGHNHDLAYAAAGHSHDSAYLGVALKGAASGLAELDAGGLVPLDQLPEMAGGATNYATLAALKAVSTMADDDQALLEGFGLYRYDAASTELDDDELVIKPTSVGAGAGRWLMESVNPDGVLAYTEPEFSAIWDVIGPVKGMLAGTVTYNLPSIAAAGVSEFYVTIEGAVPGSPVTIGLPPAFNNTLIAQAVVTADHTVKIFVRNHTASAVDAAEGVFTLVVYTL